MRPGVWGPVPLSGSLAFDTIHHKIGDHILNGVTYTPPSQWYLGLTYLDTASGFTEEITGGGYARVPVTLSINQSPGFGMNDAELAFPVATADWPEYNGFGLFDAATGGSLFNWIFLTTVESNPVYRQTVLTGQRLKFGLGGFWMGWFRGLSATNWQGVPDSYRQKLYQWIYMGGAAVPAGGVQVLLADASKNEFTVANGYTRKTGLTWHVPDPAFSIREWMPTTSMVWTVTGAWTPNASPYHIALHNGTEIISWGQAMMGSTIPALAAGDTLTYPTYVAFSRNGLFVEF